MKTYYQTFLAWALLGWAIVTGLVIWSGRAGKWNLPLLVSAYSAVLIHGIFFLPREKFRQARIKYLGFAVILAFYLFLSYAAFAKQ